MNPSTTNTISADQALRTATLGGAKALVIDDLVGSIRTGKQADIIAIDTRSPAMQPIYSPISQLAYNEAASAVSHVWIAGKAKVVNRQLVDIDLDALSSKIQRGRNTITQAESAQP